VLYKEVEN